ncbi:snRNA-activating protein complex, subunit 3 [Dimargaris cristalligena]|uniref:snRNA-activating protein complex, subunit 3 n=1 Tax=Dimargaris cristalligena TaxID=215637 RepID=A0A4Q0A040_9FUNG|nr:snRNA-activating protein complex, subunit 3 [Dimargaris cristalligena]|eukprot:RKP38460.1 snRNA-activating protein complex, subunit 3 [Dimargaris cristalligena]
MSQTRFADLTLDLFTPYTFMHQGDCEHTLVITDVRKPIPLHDANNALVYPRQSFRCFQKRHRCRMCRNAPSDLVTADDFYSGQNPCFFCQNCYDLFHYGDKGELLYEYKVFPYVGGW